MRAALLAFALVLAAAPAAADVEEDVGITLTDLVITFNPMTQATEFAFHLANDANGATGALRADVTAHDDLQPRTRLVVTGGTGSLGPGAEGDFLVVVPAYLAVKGCIVVHATASGVGKITAPHCAMSSGLTQAPQALPDPDSEPEAPDVPSAPEAPPAPDAPELPPAEPPTLP